MKELKLNVNNTHDRISWNECLMEAKFKITAGYIYIIYMLSKNVKMKTVYHFTNYF